MWMLYKTEHPKKSAKIIENWEFRNKLAFRKEIDKQQNEENWQSRNWLGKRIEKLRNSERKTNASEKRIENTKISTETQEKNTDISTKMSNTEILTEIQK